jgi:MOSC domain-containing protein YiiM
MNGSAIVGSLISVNVGQPREIEWRGKTYRTSIWKSPVQGKVKVSRLNVAGDGQADLVGHGGEQRAVFVYQMDSYRHWSTFLNRDDLAPGQFGENFTVEGLSDAEVCIGDRFSIGTAIFGVSAPRVACFKVASAWTAPTCPLCSCPIVGRASIFASSKRGKWAPGMQSTNSPRGRNG